MQDIIRPKWVLVDNVCQDVTAFAHLEPRFRPQAFCPVCKQEVVLKLGEERVHHYAHKPNVTCLAESHALQLNTIHYLYDQLLSAHAIIITTYCNCGNEHDELWLHQWDNMVIEGHSIRLLSDGKTLGAITVGDVVERNTLVIKPSVGFYEGNSRWTLRNPLPYINKRVWVCPTCQPPEQSIIEVLQADMYFRSGKKYRSIFTIKGRVTDGKSLEMWVENNGNVLLTSNSIDKLRSAVDAHLKERKKQCVILDADLWSPYTTVTKQWKYGWINNRWNEIRPAIKLETIPLSGQPYVQEAVPCQYCGVITSDWVHYNGATKLCTCRNCRK